MDIIAIVRLKVGEPLLIKSEFIAFLFIFIFSFIEVANAITITSGSLPNAIVGQSYSFVITASGSVGTITFSVVNPASLPPGLSVNASTGEISGTPTTAGTYNVAPEVTDSVSSIYQKSSIIVSNSALLITTTTLPVPTLGQSYNQTINTSGGNAPVTFSITVGSLPAGLSLNTNTGAITGTPTTAGSYSFTIAATDSDPASTSKTYTGTIGGSTAPAKDATVVGTIKSQVDASRRFSEAQIYNVSTHLTRLHHEFNPSMGNFSKGFTFQGVNIDTLFQDDAPEAALNMLTQVALQNQSTPLPNNPTPLKTNDKIQKTSKHFLEDSMAALWLAGTLNYGSLKVQGQKNKFHTSGITMGLDYKVNTDLIAGTAVGFGIDETKIDGFGSLSKGSNTSAAVYASHRLRKKFFIDGLLGYGKLSTKNHRWITTDRLFVNGNRDGENWFGHMAFSGEFRDGPKMISPFVQGDVVLSRLNAYNESGASTSKLSYDKVNINSTTLTFGTYGFYDFKIYSGMLTPFAKLQYSTRFNTNYNQRVYFSDTGPSSNSISPILMIKNIGTAQAGIRYAALNGITSMLSYDRSYGSNSLVSNTLKATLQINF